MPVRRSVERSASEDRLQKLVAQRLAPGADKQEIDRRIWDLFGEEWAIMVTDLTGFSRGVAEFGIVHFLQTIYESERLLVPIVEENDGILLKAEGDSYLIIFRNPTKAIRAALEMQQALRTYNESRDAIDQVLLGVGLGFGKVLRIGDADVFGLEVNAAYVLGEDTAHSYEILVTDSVRRATGEERQFEPIEDAPPGCGSAWRLVY